jgi:hypothetical protein
VNGHETDGTDATDSSLLTVRLVEISTRRTPKELIRQIRCIRLMAVPPCFLDARRSRGDELNRPARFR